MGMRVDIATLFPEMCQRVLDESILGRAARRGCIETHCHQIRDYTLNRQKQTDDYPYGGGCGMVMYAQPIADCIRAIQRQVAEQGRPAPHIVFMTAGGQRYTEAHARRLAAWKAEGRWFKENQPQMDEIYDKLVHLRDGMGKKLGYEGYTTLGYYRMQRNCYTKADIEQFRAAVVRYLVPVADRVCRAQAERLGVPYPMSYADEALMFRSGNPRPVGDADAILAMGKTFYDELSPETSVFFNTMLDGKLLDVLSTPGKASGGYCTSLPDYNVPFIFANFNGTQGDVEVVTHEAGHAFAAWTNRDRVPMQYTWPTMEACEVHSMSMEFFAWPWAEGFFGKDAAKFRYSHLAAALTFIPYGTAVDHFQHIVYEKPDLTPAERHAVWKDLLGTYMPWLRLDGDIPFYGDGESWQQKHHIYSSPFYYIDYCLAQTVSLEFWAMIQQDPKDAWAHYMAYTRQGGTKVFTELLANAGMVSPFEPDCLRSVCEAASRWLDSFDLTGIA